jgi:hypothetical protein
MEKRTFLLPKILCCTGLKMENNPAQALKVHQRIFHYTREMEKENRERD